MQFLKHFLLLVLICSLNSISAQIKTIGTPFIQNFSRTEYRAGSQTWDIAQGGNGMMYFANNNGLLEFDGNYWRIYPMPNNSIIRSVKNGNDTIIYAGGFNEFGFYSIGDMGGAHYHSLMHLLPENMQNFGDVWNIYIHPDGVIFQTYTRIMLLKNNDISIIEAPSSFHFSFLVNNELYINDLDKGLMRYAMGKLHPLMGLEKLIGKEIWGIQALNEKLLIATASDGIFVYNGNSIQAWDVPSLPFLIQNQVYSLKRLNNNLLAFGTIQNGILICNADGIPLQHINMEDGLQNNTILSIEQDKYDNIWLGTDLGIDYIKINSPLSQLSYNYGLSAGYTAIVFKNKLYVGTNQGLLSMKMSDFEQGGINTKEATLIEETRGQVWSLQVIDNQLFCGHHNGTFLIEDNSAKKIAEIQGAWCFVKIPGDPSKIIGGNYSGLSLFQKTGNQWRFIKQFENFSESSRTIAFDEQGLLWMAHGYKGVFQIRFDPLYDKIIKVSNYNAQNSNLSSSDVSLTKIKNQIVFNNLDRTYTFSSTDNRFIPFEKLNNYFKGNVIRSLKEDRNGNIWYFKDNNSGVLRLREDANFSDVSIPFRKIRDKYVKGFEFVYPFDEKNVFFGAEDGFIHYNSSINKNYDYPFKTYLRTMRSFNPDSVYTIKEKRDQKISLEYKNNDLEFIFSANDFENAGEIHFSSFMEGYDKNWTEWQSRSFRDFTNLSEGDYTFRVRARNNYGTESEEVVVAFKVLPPFQRSVIAYFIYGIFVVILLIIFAWILKRRFERQKAMSEKAQLEIFRKKEEKLQRETLEAEKQLIKMKNEKLREEMKQKDKELANSTMQTLQKNRMLITLRDEMKKLAALSNDITHNHEVKRMVRQINREIDDENQWKVFETHFENVHEEFLKRLKTAFPDLTPRELKLCAYLRLNISSKEIALLMNISTRGVEISRYRIRKKLNLSRETNLTDFILSF